MQRNAHKTSKRQVTEKSANRLFLAQCALDYVFACPGGGMADTKDLKSFARKGVRVRIPSRVPLENQGLVTFHKSFFHAFFQFSVLLIVPH